LLCPWFNSRSSLFWKLGKISLSKSCCWQRPSSEFRWHQVRTYSCRLRIFVTFCLFLFRYLLKFYVCSFWTFVELFLGTRVCVSVCVTRRIFRDIAKPGFRRRLYLGRAPKMLRPRKRYVSNVRDTTDRHTRTTLNNKTINSLE